MGCYRVDQIKHGLSWVTCPPTVSKQLKKKTGFKIMTEHRDQLRAKKTLRRRVPIHPSVCRCYYIEQEASYPFKNDPTRWRACPLLDPNVEISLFWGVCILTLELWYRGKELPYLREFSLALNSWIFLANIHFRGNFRCQWFYKDFKLLPLIYFDRLP